MCLLYLLSFYFVFIFAYSSLNRFGDIETYRDLVSPENLASPAYKARYFAVALISVSQLSLVSNYTSRIGYFFFVSAFIMLGFFLLASSGSLLLGLSAPVLALSALSISGMLLLLKETNKLLLVASFILLLLPSTLALISGKSEFLTNTFYGRERLVLAFFHPKETAGCTFFVFMVAIAWFRSKLSSNNSIRLVSAYFWTLIYSPFLYLLIGSRTTFLLGLGYSLANLLPLIKPFILRFYLTIFSFFLAALCFLMAISNEYLFTLFDNFSANRFSLWSSYLAGSVERGISGSKIASALDNSYLNLWFDASPIGTILFVIALLFLLIFLSRRDYVFVKTSRFYISTAPAIFMAFILLAGFTDSGLTSPTSLNFLSAWSLLLFIIAKPSQVDLHSIPDDV